MIDTSKRNVDNYFGLPTDNAARAAFFCGAGVDNGTCPYGQPARGFFGNAAIATESGPSFFNIDFSIGKKFPITERQYFDFRAEFFNGLNHVSWAPPAFNLAAPPGSAWLADRFRLPATSSSV